MRTVADIMVSMPIVLEVPGSRNDAINAMVRNGLTGLPVVRSSDGALVGIVSRRDVFRNFEEEQLSLIMHKTDIKTVSSKTTIREAAELLVDRRIHRLPVVDDGRLVGIITPTDLLDEVKNMKTDLTAEDVMTTKCVTAYENEPLSYTIAAMRVSDVSAMPVLNEKGKLTGIITDRDLFKNQLKDPATMKKLGITDAYESLAGYRNVVPLFYVATQKEIPEDQIVKDFMVRDPVAVFKKTPLSMVAKVMKTKDFGQIPVFGNMDNLIGMIYDIDVISALCR